MPRPVHRTTSISRRRYVDLTRIAIRAPVERVWALATDPQVVPRYAREIVRLEAIEVLPGGDRLVRSHMRLGPLVWRVRYRYRYRRPAAYAGIQEGGLLRGFFAFSFRARGEMTIVRHAEGVLSRLPGLAPAAGLLYFRLLHPRGGPRAELWRLKALAEERIS